MGLYDNLSVTTPLADWDEIAINPDASIPDDGFYDAIALVAGIAPGDTLSGFSVQFDWLGAGTPGNQFFDVVDSGTFDVLESGETVLASAPVPEPATLWLMQPWQSGFQATPGTQVAICNTAMNLGQINPEFLRLLFAAQEICNRLVIQPALSSCC